MQKELFYIVVIVCSIALTACEKDVPINLPYTAQQVVVDGEIEAGKGAVIAVTYSADYFSNIDSMSLRNYLITKAKVTLTSSNNEREVLTLKPNNLYFPSIVYTSFDIVGKVGVRYQLSVNFRGDTTFASTHIVEATKIDSAWWQPTLNDTIGKIVFRFKDPSPEVNYFRVFFKRKKDDRYALANPLAFSDRWYSDDTITISYDRVLKDLKGGSFIKGDTVTLKFCSIDQEQFNFWNGFQYEVLTASNPFASSYAILESNVDNGLGYFGGYAADYYNVICQ